MKVKLILIDHSGRANRRSRCTILFRRARIICASGGIRRSIRHASSKPFLIPLSADCTIFPYPAYSKNEQKRFAGYGL
ncbi:MAG: hypothetical protein ACLUOF_08645 [Ruminococcus sp.]